MGLQGRGLIFQAGRAPGIGFLQGVHVADEAGQGVELGLQRSRRAKIGSDQIALPLDGAHVPEGDVEADMTEWITFAHAGEADHDSGLVFLEKPLEGSR